MTLDPALPPERDPDPDADDWQYEAALPPEDAAVELLAEALRWNSLRPTDLARELLAASPRLRAALAAPPVEPCAELRSALSESAQNNHDEHQVYSGPTEFIDCSDAYCQRATAALRVAPPRRCGCTADAELGAGSVCPSCGHRDHGRSGCDGGRP